MGESCTAGTVSSAIEGLEAIPVRWGPRGRFMRIRGLGNNSTIGKKSNCATSASLWRTATGVGREWLRLWVTIVASKLSDYCGRSRICRSRTSLISARCKLPRPASTCGVCMRPAWLRKNRKVAASCTVQQSGAADYFARWTYSGRVRPTDNHAEKIRAADALNNNSTFCQLSNYTSG